MNYSAVLRCVATLHAALAIALIIPLISAIIFREMPQVSVLSFTCIIILSLCLLLFLIVPKTEKSSGAPEGLAIAIIWWVTAPLIFSIPLQLTFPQQTITANILEAALCISTSGLSAYDITAQSWPDSLIVFRGLLHFAGAGAYLAFAATVLAAINVGGPGIYRVDAFSVHNKRFDRYVLRVAIFVYGVLATGFVACSVLLSLLGEPLQTAALLSGNIMTTGIINPAPISLDNNTVAVVIAGLLMISAFGLVLVLAAQKKQLVSLARDPEIILGGILLLTFVLFAYWFGAPLIDALLWSASAISTSGMAHREFDVGEVAPLALLIAPALIGGAALSTTGGMKLARFWLLLRRGAQEFSRLSYPQSVVTLNYKGRRQPAGAIIGIWAYLIALTVASFACMFMLTLTGSDFESSILGGIGMLTASGGLIERSAVLDNPQNHGLALAILLIGRLEIIAVLPAFRTAFWRS